MTWVRRGMNGVRWHLVPWYEDDRRTDVDAFKLDPRHSPVIIANGEAPELREELRESRCHLGLVVFGKVTAKWSPFLGTSWSRGH
jgi:hypothetical protein